MDEPLAKDVYFYLSRQIENDAARIRYDGMYRKRDIETAIEKARLLGIMDATPFEEMLAHLLKSVCPIADRGL